MKIQPENIDQLFRQAAEQFPAEPPAELMQQVLDQWQHMGGSASVDQSGMDQVRSTVKNPANQWNVFSGMGIGKAVLLGIGVVGAAAAVWLAVSGENTTPAKNKENQQPVASVQENKAAVAPKEQVNTSVGSGNATDWEIDPHDDWQMENGERDNRPENLREEVSGLRNPSNGLNSDKNGNGNENTGGSLADNAEVGKNTPQGNMRTYVPKMWPEQKSLEFVIQEVGNTYTVGLDKAWEDSGEVRIDWGLGTGYVLQKSKSIFLQQPMNLTVRVQVVRNGKVIRSANQKIFVEPIGDGAYEILVPEIITRNGDGLNDEFYVKMPKPEYFELMVMDKANRILFRSNDETVKWSGIKNGVKVEEGEYAVLVAYRYSNQKNLAYVRKILIVKD